MNLQYVAEWDKNPEKTWSGTTFQLMKALQESSTIDYVEKINIKKVGINKYYIHLLIEKFSRILGKSYKYDTNFDINILHKKDKINMKQINDDVLSLQIGDLVNVKNSFVYQDLSINVLTHIYHMDKAAWEYSGFKGIPYNNLIARQKWQEQFYKNQSMIFTMSRWLEKFLKDKGYQNTKYVGAGIKPFELKKISKKTNKQLLFVGRNFTRKGGDLVVAAFKELIEIYPDITLTIAGPDSLDDSLLIEGITWEADVTTQRVSELMYASDIFIMPSRFEAFGLVFVEAMAHGLPIIGRDKFEMPYFVKEGSGINIKTSDEADEIKQIVRAVTIIFGDPSYSNSAVEKAPEIIEKYSWENVADRMVDSF